MLDAPFDALTLAVDFAGTMVHAACFAVEGERTLGESCRAREPSVLQAVGKRGQTNGGIGDRAVQNRPSNVLWSPDRSPQERKN